MHKTSLITRLPHELQTHISNVYSTSTIKSDCPKLNSWFCSQHLLYQILLNVQAKILQLSLTLHPSSHLWFNPSAYPISSNFKTYTNFNKKILAKKKLSRIWPTTSHRIYCHHHGTSPQSFLDYYKNHLTHLPASIFTPHNLTLSLS